jgi:N-acetylneuraminate synthase
MRTFVIAEAGVNHNGDIELAKRLVEVAAASGADAVKFQSFQAKMLVSRGAAKAEYQTRTTDRLESQYEMIKKLELSPQDHRILALHAKRVGIQFLSTPFDFQSLDLLVQDLGLATIKVPSGELTNAPLLLAVARASKHIILSTGMSDTQEIRQALGVLVFGFSKPLDEVPGTGAFERCLVDAKSFAALSDRVTLLHCTSEYPAPFCEVNLRAMETLSTEFGLPVGLSDHSIGIHVAIAAVALGARIIEKHFTLDRHLPGPDHSASLEPLELTNLVERIRDIEAAMGSGVKVPSPSEIANRSIVRKSLVASIDIAPGEPFTTGNVTCKRPGTGRSPFQYWEILGRKASKGYKTDELLID